MRWSTATTARVQCTTSAALTLAERYFQRSLSLISQEEFKDFLRHRLVNDKVSVSTLNQTIGAFRLYVDKTVQIVPMISVG